MCGRCLRLGSLGVSGGTGWVLLEFFLEFRADSPPPGFPEMSGDTLSSARGKAGAGCALLDTNPGKDPWQGSLGLPSQILGRFWGGFCGSHSQFWEDFWGYLGFLPKF